MNNNGNSFELLLRMVELHWAEIDHFEEQRDKHVSLIILIASALLGLVYQRNLVKEDWPLAVFVGILGLYGIVFVQKMYERYSFLQSRLDSWYATLDSMAPDAKFMAVRLDALAKHRARFWFSTKLPVNVLWQVINVVLIVFAMFVLTTMFWK